MSYLKHRFTSVLLIISLTSILCLTSIQGYAEEIDIEPGMWEWTMTMEMEGMPFALPPTSYSVCTTKEDLIPDQSGSPEECTKLEQKITGNRVSWKMECDAGGEKMSSIGEMTYNGSSASGEIHVMTQGMKMTTKIAGKRTGDCDQ